MASTGNHLNMGGFEAWVVADDKTLPHLKVERNESTNEVCAWIPSEAGQKFWVSYGKVTRNNFHYTADLSVDGRKVHSRLHQTCVQETERPSFRTACFIEISPSEGNFRGSNDCIDTAMRSKSATTPEENGQIKLVLQVAQLTRKDTEETDPKSLSDTKQRPRDIAGLYQVGNPITFIFNYQSTSVSQAEEIVSQPTSQVKDNESLSHTSGEIQIAQPKVEALIVKREFSDGEWDSYDQIVLKEGALIAELAEIRRQKKAMRDVVRPGKRMKTEFR